MKYVQGTFLYTCLISIALPLLAMPAQDVSLSLAKLESPDPNVRITAYYELFSPKLGFAVNAKEGTLKLLSDHPENRVAIVQALISLLRRDNALANQAAPGTLGEAFGDYHASLIWSVATLHDASSVDALLGAIKTGGLATDGLAALGASAIPAVLGAVDSVDPGVRMGATMVLGKMALQHSSLTLDTASMNVIRSSLLRSTKDVHYSVRWAAVLSLEPFHDAEVRSVVKRTATIDTSDRVRLAADKWLTKHQASEDLGSEIHP